MDHGTRFLAGLMASATLLFAAFSTDAASPGNALPPPRPPSAIADLESFGPLAPLQTDAESLSSIFSAYRSGDWTEALILKSKLTDPAAAALSEWFAIRSAIPVGWARLTAFSRDYPDWPASSLLR